jgi:type IV pilus assembly protein PilA
VGVGACQSCGFILERDDASVATGDSPRRGWAIASLVLGLLSVPTLGLLGIGALLGIIFGIVALVKASQQPETYGGKGLAISGIVASAFSFIMIPFIGIIAAIAIPSLLRARISANEAGTLGDLRTLISAERAYHSATGGVFDTPECLLAPSRCIPNYSVTGPTFLRAEALAPTRHGYLRTFHSGPPLRWRPVGKATLSPSSMRSFAYVAVPLGWGQTGTRAFCADSTGQICYTTRGEEPAVAGGLCSGSCRPLS